MSTVSKIFNNAKYTSLVAGAAALVGGFALSKFGHKDETTSLESQFGTSDGHFPSAKPGAHLAKPPGNKEHLVGKHYTSNFERRSYSTKRSKEEHMAIQRKKTLGH